MINSYRIGNSTVRHCSLKDLKIEATLLKVKSRLKLYNTQFKNRHPHLETALAYRVIFSMTYILRKFDRMIRCCQVKIQKKKSVCIQEKAVT